MKKQKIIQKLSACILAICAITFTTACTTQNLSTSSPELINPSFSHTQSFITPSTTDQTIYTTTQGINIKKQNQSLYLTINNSTYEVLGQGESGYENYKLLEYIESTTNAYLNTDYIHTTSTEIKMKCHISSSQGYNNAVMWGTKKGDATNEFALFVASSGNKWLGYGRYQNGEGWNKTSIQGTTGVFETNDNTVTYTTTSNNTFTCNSNSTTLSTGFGPITIFALNISTTAGGVSPHSTCYGRGKVYYFKIYENTTLVRDFIPIQNPSGTNGLFDLVENKFYSNTGTTNFTAGPILASSENKYVDPSPAGEAIAQTASKRQIAGIEFYPGVESGYLLCKNNSGEYLQILI